MSRQKITAWLHSTENLFPFIAGPVLLLCYLAAAALQKRLVTHDATLWIRYGQQLFTGNLERFGFNGGAPPFSPLIWTPGYPFLTGLADLITGHTVFSAYAVSAAGAAGLALVIYYAARDIFGAPTARFAFVLTALYPPMFVFATSTVIRPVALFFLYLSLYQTYRLLRDGKNMVAVSAGLAMGATILCRFEFALYAVVITCILIISLSKRPLAWRHMVLYTGMIVAVYAVYAVPLYRVAGYAGLSPYISRLVVSEPFPEKEHVNRENYKKANLGMRNVLYNGNTASRLNLLNQKEVRVAPLAEGVARAVPTPRKPIWRHYADLLRYILPRLLLKMAPLLLLGAYFLFKNGRAGSLLPFTGMVAATFVFFPVLGGATGLRYYTQAYPYFLMLSGYGAACGLAVLQKRFQLKYILPAGGVLLAGFLTAVNLRELPREYSIDDRVWLQAAAYLKRTAQPEETVFARKRFPAFYAGLRSELLPDEQNLDDVYAYATYVGASYLVLDEAVTCVGMPQYLPLMGDAVPVPLDLLVELNPGTGHACRIFRFTRSTAAAEQD